MTEKTMQYSVLMSVYFREDPENLRTAMKSMFDQTVPTDDFVLVCDGPLNEPLDAVILDFSRMYPAVLSIVRLPENLGLGFALNKGLRCCRNELVARMDSDDISRPDRCERQIKVFETSPEISIVSGTVEEFSVSPDKVEASRRLPEKSNEILLFSKKRNPFNHPCVMYKKTAVYSAGGYKPFYLLEDYYLWVRMLQNGCMGNNIQEPLLWMRAGTDMYKRRAGLRYAKSQKKLFDYMLRTGYINTLQYVFSVSSRAVSSLVPNEVRRKAFRTLLRK